MALGVSVLLRLATPISACQLAIATRQFFCQGGNLPRRWLVGGHLMLLAGTVVAGRIECRFRLSRNLKMPRRELFRHAKRDLSVRMKAAEWSTFDW